MPDMTVIRYGTDSSGRAVLMTRYMADWWRGVLDDLPFTPTIVQGAWMARLGGGASASAGYHDAGGCLDLRTWDRTGSEIDLMNRVIRLHGAGGWRRDQAHGGFDPHYHLVLGSDGSLASGARTQWSQYLAGRDGLASNGPDYEWRPSPLVTTPPTSKGLTMDKEVTAAFADVRDDIAALGDRIDKFATGEVARDRADYARMKQLIADGRKAKKSAAEILAAVEAEADAPAGKG